MQGWTCASGCIFGEEDLIPHFHWGFIHCSSSAQAWGFQLLGCICSFPLCSLSVPAGPRGSRPHLISWMGFYGTHHALQGTKVSKSKESSRAGCGRSLVLAAVQWHSRDWAGVCTTCFAPRATMQLPLESENTSVNSMKFMTQEWYNSGNTSSWREPHLSHGKFCYYYYFWWLMQQLSTAVIMTTSNTCDIKHIMTTLNTKTFLECPPHLRSIWGMIPSGKLGSLQLPPVRCVAFAVLAIGIPNTDLCWVTQAVTPTLPLSMAYM